ncbi:DUF4192 domain-containing protein, partial [Geodermatophilus sp. YIM 151500]|uniref:DUF4192 domain-containing protein n=1 Tax=Geodermatophilus sp. YIM 151500 TaxID=2984531 RepID=UPI0021E37923
PDADEPDADEPDADEPDADDPDADRGLPHRGLVHELVLAAAAAGLPVRQALLVRRGRWWSYDCPHPCCAPGAGTPLPEDVGELAAASVAAGTVVAADRDELLARIAPPDGSAAAAMTAAVLRAGHAAAGRADGGAEAAAAAAWRTITAAVARCATGRPRGSRLSDDEVAGVVWALRDVRVRDRALGLSLGGDPAAAETLWTECTRRAPAPLDAAPATLLAVAAWLRGDGAMAGIALDRALAGDPGYALAGLLARALAACLPPAELRALVAGTLADLRAADRGRPGARDRAPAGVRGGRGGATPGRGRARRGRR